jgi:hypothetical protein
MKELFAQTEERRQDRRCCCSDRQPKSIGSWWAFHRHEAIDVLIPASEEFCPQLYAEKGDATGCILELRSSHRYRPLSAVAKQACTSLKVQRQSFEICRINRDVSGDSMIFAAVLNHVTGLPSH